MVDRERRLGRGLDSLISAARDKSLSLEVVQSAGHRIQSLALESLDVNPYQPRRDFPVAELNGLVESLRTHGLMQPLVARRTGDRFQLIAGERRLRAARELGWTHIDGVVVEADDRKMLEWALIENLQRQDLGPLEIAEAIRGLVERFHIGHEEAARVLGMSRPSVSNHLRLLDLPAVVKLGVSRGTISMGAARAILAIDDAMVQESLARQVEEGLLTVRQIENLARERQQGASRRTPPASQRDPNVAALEQEVQEQLGTKARIRGSVDRGQLVIDYASRSQLDLIIRRLRGLAPQFQGPAGDDDTLESESITV